MILFWSAGAVIRHLAEKSCNIELSYGTLRNGSGSSYISGSDLCKFYSRPLDIKSNAGDVEPEYESEKDDDVALPSENIPGTNLISVATQTDYRESEAQTDPWDPPFVVRKIFKEPEVLLLQELSYGNGLPVSQTEIDYILESRKNRELDVCSKNIDNYEAFMKKKEHFCSQVRNDWNYKISRQSEKLLEKLKQMEITLTQELKIKSERQEKLLKNLWNQKRDQMAKMNSKLQKELKKELKGLEKRSRSGTQRFDVRAYGADPVSKELTNHINSTKESLNQDIDYLITKYHMNPNGLSKLTDWLERKRTDLYNEVPLPKPVQKNRREKLTERAYQDLLTNKRTKMPEQLYHEDYDKEESVASLMKSEVEFEVLELPEEGVDLVTVWQQVLRGRAYQKQMLELIDNHKDSLDIVLSSQILRKL